MQQYIVRSAHLNIFVPRIVATLLLFAVHWDLFKVDVDGQPHLWEDPRLALQWYLIPVFAGGIASTETTMRLLRSQMLEVLREDYVVTARAKGLQESTIIMRHVLHSAWLPVLTVMGLTVATIIGSQIVPVQMLNVPSRLLKNGRMGS